MLNCFEKAKAEIKNTIFESRMDSAFFNQDILSMLNGNKIKFTASVPFERFTELKKMIEECTSWNKIDKEWSYFETQWKPKSWKASFRFIFTRRKNKKQQKGPLQLKPFEPTDFQYDYKVVVTNKPEPEKYVVLFHNGRGSQEAVFGDAKNHAALDSILCRSIAANQVFTLSAMMAHNLTREMQMLAHSAAARTSAKRPAVWKFQKLDSIRHRFIQRAGRLIRPQGKLTLVMSANKAVRENLLHFIDVLQKAT